MILNNELELEVWNETACGAQNDHTTWHTKLRNVQVIDWEVSGVSWEISEMIQGPQKRSLQNNENHWDVPDRFCVNQVTDFADYISYEKSGIFSFHSGLK